MVAPTDELLKGYSSALQNAQKHSIPVVSPAFLTACDEADVRTYLYESPLSSSTPGSG